MDELAAAAAAVGTTNDSNSNADDGLEQRGPCGVDSMPADLMEADDEMPAEVEEVADPPPAGDQPPPEPPAAAPKPKERRTGIQLREHQLLNARQKLEKAEARHKLANENARNSGIDSKRAATAMKAGLEVSKARTAVDNAVQALELAEQAAKAADAVLAAKAAKTAEDEEARATFNDEAVVFLVNLKFEYEHEFKSTKRTNDSIWKDDVAVKYNAAVENGTITCKHRTHTSLITRCVSRLSRL